MNTPILRPEQIEQASMSVIEKLLGDKAPKGEEAPVIKRVIHATADLEYADTLYFSPGALQAAQKALRDGAHIVCDTKMVEAGIAKGPLAALGGQVHCFMADADVAAEAKAREVTRATVSMERAVGLDFPLIFAIGNAPTALIRLWELIGEGRLRPRLVIGVPVGFVNVVESKELFLRADFPAILNRGRKGGSPVAAAICNALIYGISREN